MKKDKKIKIQFVLILILILIFCTVSLYVPTHDDYSIPYGNDISGSIDNAKLLGNGRYIGNFLGNLLSLRYIYNTIIKTLIIFSIIVFVAYIADELSLSAILVSALLLAFPSCGIYSQCYIWSMGFYNYGFPLALYLLTLSIIKHKSDSKNLFWELCIVFVLGISQMLFSENETVVFTASAMILTIMLSTCHKNSRKTLAGIYLISSLIGMVIIFFGPKFMGNSDNMNHYRSLLLPSFPINLYLISLLERLSTLQGYIIDFHVLWIVLLLTIYKKEIDGGIKKRRAISDLILLSVLYVTVILLKEHIIPIQKWNYTNLLVVVTSTFIEFYVISRVLATYESDVLKPLGAILLLAVISVAELIPVDPIGERCVFITYVLLALVLVKLFSKTFEDNKVVHKILCVVSMLSIYCILIMQLSKIHIIYNEKVGYIELQMSENKNPVEVIEFPETKLLWYPNSNYGLKYVYNNGTPGDIEFINITYNEYLTKNDESMNYQR